MARTNISVKKDPVYTHEGAKASHLTPREMLERSVMACMLWENSFYEDGISIALRIHDLVGQVAPAVASEIAIRAREKMHLRHAPLWIAVSMCDHFRGRSSVATTIERIIQRADELSEIVSLYWRGNKKPLSSQLKKGLARAFTKFDAYHLAKYNRDTAVKLRDVLFLCHAKPKDAAQEILWKQLIDNKLPIPDTWEVALSAGGDKKETFERLIRDRKLGAMALLRNLRNCVQAKVDKELLREAILTANYSRVLPFRFIAAAANVPMLEPIIEQVMMGRIGQYPVLPGNTLILVDVSGSMDQMLSEKSDMTRMDAACGVAMIAKEISNNATIATFSDKCILVPPRTGFALRDAIVTSQRHSGTLMGKALEKVRAIEHDIDRTIIITDEQSHDPIGLPIGRGYIINVASYKHGIGYGPWTHINGWSESVIDYIVSMEMKEGKAID